MRMVVGCGGGGACGDTVDGGDCGDCGCCCDYGCGSGGDEEGVIVA